MLLFFVLFIFFILHIQFLLRNIFFGVDEAKFFIFTIKYGFDRAVALQSLYFSLACAGGFALGYKLFYRRRKVFAAAGSLIRELRITQGEVTLLNAAGLAMVAYMSAVIGVSRLDYTAMVSIREDSGFIFELRVVFLLLVSHLMLNHSWGEVLHLPELKGARKVILLYFVCVILFQARSALFELGAIVAYAQLIRTGDKIKIKYIAALVAAMLVPNLIILGRLGVPNDPVELFNGIFSFEYAILFNNYLSAAIVAGKQGVQEFTFLASLKLLIPSPIRDALGMVVVKSEYYSDIAIEANNSGGGFSLLAEMYTNFKWFSFLAFAGLGGLIGHWNARATRSGNVSIRYAAAPLLYVSFVLAFRNDFGVFLKYFVQLLVISWFVSLFFPKQPGRYFPGGGTSSNLHGA